MKILKEFLDPTTIQLSNIEKIVLVSIYAAATPAAAYDATLGAENTISARDSLSKLGLIRTGRSTSAISDNGEKALYANNLVDDMGEVTDEGRELQSKLPSTKVEFNESIRPFKFLRSFDP